MSKIKSELIAEMLEGISNGECDISTYENNYSTEHWLYGCVDLWRTDKRIDENYKNQLEDLYRKLNSQFGFTFFEKF